MNMYPLRENVGAVGSIQIVFLLYKLSHASSKLVKTVKYIGLSIVCLNMWVPSY